MSETKTVTITRCEPKKRKDGSFIEGVSAKGKPWRIHNVDCTDETGLPLQDKMIAFELLPLGEPVTLEFVAKDDPEYGREYTLSYPKGARRPAPVDDGYEALREADRLMLDRIAALEDAVKGLGGFSSTFRQTDVPVPAQAPVTASPVDDDQSIPF